MILEKNEHGKRIKLSPELEREIEWFRRYEREVRELVARGYELLDEIKESKSKDIRTNQ